MLAHTLSTLRALGKTSITTRNPQTAWHVMTDHIQRYSRDTKTHLRALTDQSANCARSRDTLLREVDVVRGAADQCQGKGGLGHVFQPTHGLGRADLRALLVALASYGASGRKHGGDETLPELPLGRGRTDGR